MSNVFLEVEHVDQEIQNNIPINFYFVRMCIWILSLERTVRV